MQQEELTIVFNIIGHILNRTKNGAGLLHSLTRAVDIITEDRHSGDKDPRIIIRIDSPGGSAEETLSVFGYLTGITQDITTIAFGCVHSAATLIYLTGSNRIALPSSQFMFHGGSLSITDVPYQEVASHIKAYFNRQRAMIDIIANATNQPKKRVQRWYKNGAAFTAREAHRFGIVQNIQERIPSPDKPATTFTIVNSELSRTHETL